jgi:hypothetical protein
MGMDIDYIAAKQAIDKLEKILDNWEHGKRKELADLIINSVNKLEKRCRESNFAPFDDRVPVHDDKFEWDKHTIEIAESWLKQHHPKFELLSAYAHEAWCGWMKYLFSKAEINNDGTWTMPKWAVERWQRQMNTKYTELPEEEKKSDREEAHKILAILENNS